jgi:hypothetical protein
VVVESVNEAKQFDKDYADMETSIKRGIGWIEPDYVEPTWDMSSDTIEFELVASEIYNRLIKAGVLWHSDESGEEKGKQVRSLRELGIKESVVNEAEIKSDDEFKEYAMTVLKKAFGDEFDEDKAGEVVDGILKKCGDDYGACVGTLTSSLGESVTNEAIDTKYWADYNTDTSGHGDPANAIKLKVFDIAFEEAVESWNDEADGEENQIDDNQANKIERLAKEFFRKEKWISINIIHAMIAQES